MKTIVMIAMTVSCLFTMPAPKALVPMEEPVFPLTYTESSASGSGSGDYDEQSSGSGSGDMSGSGSVYQENVPMHDHSLLLLQTLEGPNFILDNRVIIGKLAHKQDITLKEVVTLYTALQEKTLVNTHEQFEQEMIALITDNERKSSARSDFIMRTIIQRLMNIFDSIKRGDVMNISNVLAKAQVAQQTIQKPVKLVNGMPTETVVLDLSKLGGFSLKVDMPMLHQEFHPEYNSIHNHHTEMDAGKASISDVNDLESDDKSQEDKDHMNETKDEEKQEKEDEDEDEEEEEEEDNE